MTDETNPPAAAADETPAPEHHEPPERHEPEHHEPPAADHVPEWGKQLTATVESLAATVQALIPEPDVPGDGHDIPDESPVKKPWTHRKLFG